MIEWIQAFSQSQPSFTSDAVMTPPSFSRALGSLRKRGLAGMMALVLVMTLTPSTAFAQTRIPLVRDAEIERLVRDYARPIFKAAGLSNQGIDIILVNDNSFNAFVTGRRMFINIGALMIAETPGEIIGVIAHEAGHIAGGHQERLRQQLKTAQTLAIIATVLGAGASVAGAATGNRGLAGVGGGIATGGNEAVRRGFLGYQRSEEITADRSAITYLNRTGQSARGLLKTFERFAGSLALSGTRINPYVVSHPLPRERIAALETLAKQSKHWSKKDSAALQQRHDMARVKIAVYTQGPAAAQRITRSNPGSLAAQYASALSNLRSGNPRNALAKADALIKKQPNNAYFHEMRGDVLIKMNRPVDAGKAYARAVKLDGGRSPILKISQGRALVATGNKDAMRQAVKVIRQGLTKEPDYASGYRFLAQAYGALGDIPAAELASAEGNFYAGEYHEAKVFAARAQQKYKRGSPGWLRAQDIIDFKVPKRRRN